MDIIPQRLSDGIHSTWYRQVLRPRARWEWNQNLKRLKPGQRVTLWRLNSPTQQWTTGEVWRMPDVCPWYSPTQADIDHWRDQYAGNLAIGEAPLYPATRHNWPRFGCMSIDHEDDRPLSGDRSLGRLLTSISDAPVGSDVTVWAIPRSDDHEVRVCIRGTLVDHDATEDGPAVWIGDPDGESLWIHTEDITHARVREERP